MIDSLHYRCRVMSLPGVQDRVRNWLFLCNVCTGGGIVSDELGSPRNGRVWTVARK
jgi:hypothetical protein